MSKSARVAKAEIIREYGPLPEAANVGGVTFDGERVWAAVGSRLQSFDPSSGELGQALPVPADAGTAFDGQHLYQLTGQEIKKVDAKTGKLIASIPAPGKGMDSGMAWAEGCLWVGQYRERKIVCIDPSDGKVLRTIESDRFVTGVSWVDGELWHATWEEEQSELRRIEPQTGEVLERLEMPKSTIISGLESDGKDSFFCGGGNSGKVRRVRRPARK